MPEENIVRLVDYLKLKEKELRDALEREAIKQAIANQWVC